MAEKNDSNQKAIEYAKFFIWVVVIIITAIWFLGSFDTRLTIVESELKHTVDKETLQKELNILKKELIEEMRTAIKEESDGSKN